MKNLMSKQLISVPMALAVYGVLTASPAHAQTITFNTGGRFSFNEAGFNIASFWVQSGFTVPASHLHVDGGVENHHWQTDNGRQGLIITKIGGGTFSFSSIDVKQFGTQSNNTNLEMGTFAPSTNPGNAIPGYTQFPIANTGGIVTVPITGFDNITILYITSQSSQMWDNIVLTPLDTNPPEVACAVDIDLLWPPNHTLIDVGLTFIAIDDTDPDPDIYVLVFADEDDEEPTGDGNHSPDVRSDDETLRLRSERIGNSNGRVYLIVVVATDATGNVGFDCCTVVVPKSKSKKDIADVDAQAAAAEAFCLEFGEPPSGFIEVGDGPIIGPKQ